MEDIPAMMDLYAQARVFMRENGNLNQWDDSYPSRELLEKDIAFGNSYIVEDDEKNLAATFAFIKGEDPTYYGIENGAWLNHEPYGTIHRLAFPVPLFFCRTIIPCRKILCRWRSVFHRNN